MLFSDSETHVIQAIYSKKHHFTLYFIANLLVLFLHCVFQRLEEHQAILLEAEQVNSTDIKTSGTLKRPSLLLCLIFANPAAEDLRGSAQLEVSSCYPELLWGCNTFFFIHEETLGGCCAIASPNFSGATSCHGQCPTLPLRPHSSLDLLHLNVISKPVRTLGQ